MNSQYITTTVTCSKFKALRTVRLACRPHASGFAQKCAAPRANVKLKWTCHTSMWKQKPSRHNRNLVPIFEDESVSLQRHPLRSHRGCGCCGYPLALSIFRTDVLFHSSPVLETLSPPIPRCRPPPALLKTRSPPPPHANHIRSSHAQKLATSGED